MLVAAIIACITFDGAKVGYFRREFPDLEGAGGAIMRSRELLAKCPKVKYNGTQHRWTFPNGSIIDFCHCHQEDDVYGYLSQQFDYIFIDESTQFTRYIVRMLTSRNRATVNGVIPFMALATNPTGIGHSFHKAEFVDVGVPRIPHEVEIEPGQYETHLFIPSFLTDNKALTDRDPRYALQLSRLPEDQRRAYRDGDWDVFTGQYFPEFRRHVHVVGANCKLLPKPWLIPEEWPRFASIDWGYAAPSAILWHAVQPSMNRVITYRELYVSRMNASNLARKFVELSAGEHIRYMKCSPDMRRESGLVPDAQAGKTAFDAFQELGIPIEIADNRRIMGWTQVREYLSVPEGDEYPWWMCFPTCPNLIRTLPELVHDTHNVEDVDEKCEDHCLSGDTIISTVNGDLPIKSLVGTEGYVYCYRQDKGRIGATRFYDVRQTSVEQVYRVWLDDGSYVDATASHPFLLRDGKTFVEVKDLKSNDSLMPFYRHLDGRGHLKIQPQWADKSMNKKPIDRSVSAHRLVYEDTVAEFDLSLDIHHIDMDKHNNHPSNLVPMTRQEHARLHGRLKKETLKRASLAAAKALKIRLALMPGHRRWLRRHMARIRPLAEAWHRDPANHEKHVAIGRKSWQSILRQPRVAITCQQCGKTFEVVKSLRTRQRFCCNNCKSAWRRAQGLDLEERTCVNCGKTYTCNKYSKSRHCSKTCIWEAKRNRRNHKVLKIEPLSVMPVFNMTTEAQNFVANGVVVHNCPESLRYFLVSRPAIADMTVWTPGGSAKTRRRREYWDDGFDDDDDVSAKVRRFYG